MNYLWGHKALAFNMSAGSSDVETLLQGFSKKELVVLAKHPDFMTRIREIAQMHIGDVMTELRTSFGLDIEMFSEGGVCISSEGLADAIPEWFSTYHCGWYKDTAGGEFLTWARQFIAQEVRINVWIEYLKHKEEIAKAARNSLDEAELGEYYGTYV